MLQSIRERATGWIAIVIFSFLLLSMGLLGIRTYMGVTDVSNVVAEVNSVSISRDTLAAALQRLQMQFQLNAQSMPANALASLQSTVLQSLIRDEVMRQAAVSEGYRVSSLQTQDAVTKMPQFQVSGRFSPDRFQQILSANDFTPAGFLDKLGSALVVDQAKRGIILSAIALPEETQRAVALVNQKRHFSWLVLTPDFLTKNLKWHPVISEQEIQAYYKGHPEAFQAPEQVSLEYLLLTENALPKPAASTDAAPNYSHLKEKLANLTYEHPDSLTEAAKELGLTIQSTSLFTREKGGKDPVSASAVVRDLAFSSEILNSGNNSDVIEIDPTTSVVIRVKQHMPARLLPLEEVRSKVVAMLTAIAIDNKLQDLAAEITQSLRSGTSVEQIAARYHGLLWQDSGWVSRQQDTKPAGDILAPAFRMEVPASGRIASGSAKVSGGYAVIVLKEVKDGNDAKGSTEFTKVSDDLESSIANTEYEMYINGLSKQAKIKIKNNPAQGVA